MGLGTEENAVGFFRFFLPCEYHDRPGGVKPGELQPFALQVHLGTNHLPEQAPQQDHRVEWLSHRQLLGFETVADRSNKLIGGIWIQEADLSVEHKTHQVHPGCRHPLTVLRPDVLSKSGNQARPGLKFGKDRITADKPQDSGHLQGGKKCTSTFLPG